MTNCYIKIKSLLPRQCYHIIQIMNQCIEKDSDNDTFELACDAFQMLSYAHCDCSNIRRHWLKPAVSKTYRKLCSLSRVNTEYLTCWINVVLEGSTTADIDRWRPFWLSDVRQNPYSNLNNRLMVAIHI